MPETPCSIMAICRPTFSRRVHRRCPFHERLEYAGLYDEHSYYAPHLTFDCGTVWDAEEGWTRPRCRYWGEGQCSNLVKATIRRDGKRIEVCGVHRRSALAKGLTVEA